MYTEIIKDYSKMAKAKHLATPSGNNAPASLFGPLCWNSHSQGPHQYSGSITNTYKAT